MGQNLPRSFGKVHHPAGTLFGDDYRHNPVTTLTEHVMDLACLAFDRFGEWVGGAGFQPGFATLDYQNTSN